MTACYDGIVEADSEDSARRRFAAGAFSQREMPLIRARQVSSYEIKEALNRKKED